MNIQLLPGADPGIFHGEKPEVWKRKWSLSGQNPEANVIMLILTYILVVFSSRKLGILLGRGQS